MHKITNTKRRKSTKIKIKTPLSLSRTGLKIVDRNAPITHPTMIVKLSYKTFFI